MAGSSVPSGGRTPLPVRMRPQTIGEIVGQRSLLRPGSPLAVLADPARADAAAASVILWGPPGSGKTTIAKVIAQTSGRRFVELSAVTAGVKDVRETMQRALDARDLYDHATVLFLDEIHRFSKAQQDALLPGVENGWVSLIAATTENPSFSVIAPLLSRSLLLRLDPLDDQDIATLLDRAVADARGLGGSVALEPEGRSALMRIAGGDARSALIALEAAAALAEETAPPGATPAIGADTVAAASDRAAVRYDRDGDEHYDVISAFIKSIRGSDADAAIHYLARMVEAGEDPRFIARRLVISASEDVGVADPRALTIAVAAAQAVQLIGMPEGRLPLAEATVYLATAPKSASAYRAIDRAIDDIRAGRAGPVPAPLRGTGYAAARRLGHGIGYRYPHDSPLGVLAQQYLPDGLQDARYYEPLPRGEEREIGQRWERLRRIVRGESDPGGSPSPV